MIAFIADDLTKKSVLYERTDFIPETVFPKYSLTTYVNTHQISEETINYLKKLVDCTDYVKNILELYIYATEQKKILKKVESEDFKIFSRSRDLTAQLFYDDLYGGLNYKEKLAVNRINLGKSIYNKAGSLAESPVIDESLKLLLEKIKTGREKLFEIQSIETEYYQKGLPEEDDIYYDCPGEVIEIIEAILPKYFLSEKYYTNSGCSVFVLSPGDYLYFVGDKRGRIKEFQKFKYYKTSFDMTLFLNVSKELTELAKEVNTFLQSSCRQQNPISKFGNKSLFDEVKKNIQGLEGFCRFVANAEPYFKVLFDNQYLLYVEDKIVYRRPCTQKVFAALLTDPDLVFSSQLPNVPTEAFVKLFGKKLNQMQQREEDTTKTANYEIVKKLLVDSKVPPYNN